MGDWYLKELKYQNHNSQNRMSNEQANRIYETFKNSVMPHGHHIYDKAHMWKMQQCVHIHSQIVHYHTGNGYCDVVPNVQVLIFLTKK